MRILLVTPGRVPLPVKLGGAIEDYILNLGRELSKLGVDDVAVLDTSRQCSIRSLQQEVVDGIRIIRIPKITRIPVNLGITSIITRSVKTLDELIWGISVRRFIEHQLRNGNLTWDIIHFNSPFPLVMTAKLLKESGVKIAYTEHTYFASKYAGTWLYRSLIEPKLESKVLSLSNAVIALSSSTEKALKVFDKNNVRVIPIGVDTSYFRPLTLEEKIKSMNLFSLENKEFIITFLGRIHPQKGLEVLIKSIKNIYDQGFDSFKLLIAGPISGDFSHTSGTPSLYFLKLKQTVARSGLSSRVKFLGRIPHHLRPLFLGISSVFVLPSFYETFGLVALEAMSCGVPVVATRVGALPDMIKNGVNGFLFSPGDIATLTSILIKLYTKPELTFNLGKNSRMIVEESYSWKKVAEKTYKLYMELLY